MNQETGHDDASSANAALLGPHANAYLARQEVMTVQVVAHICKLLRYGYASLCILVVRVCVFLL
jgi:hypothetical protein